ncbi:MAG TPA: flagellar hook-length control protein [Noviherbaspirillum sp.]|nr:flagellar hook-length control protein [Noviherbaspirillum sp.]
MSIAVSAVVRPSRILFAMTRAMATGAALVGFAIGFGLVGNQSLAVHLAIASSVLFLAFFGFYHGTRYRKTIQLDISGTGQIRLLKLAGEPPCTDSNWPHVREMGEVVRLMSDSTIWTHMLLLRLQSDDGEITIVPIFPDSVSRDGFRALSVACRWIATQKDAQGAKFF